MSRVSGDERAADGSVFNGYDYGLQVWVVGGIVKPCPHPARMRSERGPCCNAAKYAGHKVNTLAGHDERA